MITKLCAFAAPMCALHLLFIFDVNINQKTIQSIAGRGAVSVYAICMRCGCCGSCLQRCVLVPPNFCPLVDADVGDVVRHGC